MINFDMNYIKKFITNNEKIWFDVKKHINISGNEEYVYTVFFKDYHVLDFNFNNIILIDCIFLNDNIKPENERKILKYLPQAIDGVVYNYQIHFIKIFNLNDKGLKL